MCTEGYPQIRQICQGRFLKWNIYVESSDQSCRDSCIVLIAIWLHRVYHWCNKLCSKVSLSPWVLVSLRLTECVKTWYWDIREQRLFCQAEIQIQPPPKTAIPHTDLIWTMQGSSCYCRICIRVCISLPFPSTSNLSHSEKKREYWMLEII